MSNFIISAYHTAILNIKLELYAAENRMYLIDNSCDLDKIKFLNNMLAILLEGKNIYKGDKLYTNAMYEERFSHRTPERQAEIDQIYIENGINRVKF